MKLIGISDVHATSKIPRGRLGDPLSDFRNKMNYVFKLSKKLDNAPIICAGDLFNGPRDILALFKFLSITMRYPKTKFYTVYGQHDMYMRNKKVINNLAILARSGVINLLNDRPFILKGEMQKQINLYGCNWGEKFPVPKRKYSKNTSKNTVDILSIHAPITKKALFPKHVFHETTGWLKLHGYYDFIIIGDIHRAHTSYYKMFNEKQGVVSNTGPMMRLEVTNYMKIHKPHVVVYDTENKNFEIIHIPVASTKDVLNFGIHEKIITEETLGDLYINTKQIEEVNVLKIIEMLLMKAKNKRGIKNVLEEIANEINIGQEI